MLYEVITEKKYRFNRELWVNIDSAIVTELSWLLGDANVVVRK